MSQRGSRPSLYEVAQDRLDRVGQSGDPSPEQEGDAAPARFTPGSSLRLPMGFVVVGLVLVVGLIALSWWLGKGAGETEAKIDAHRQGLTRVLQDPLDSPTATGQDQSATPSPAAAETPGPTVAESTPAVVEPRSDGDPRVRGFHYFVLAETRPGGAEEIAAFCRSRGLDVAVISGHNTRLAQVIALPGLASSRSSDPVYQALDARIEEVGRKWKQSGRRTSFSDRYLQTKGD